MKYPKTLLNASDNGKASLCEFVRDRLVTKTTSIHATITRRKSKTLASLQTGLVNSAKQKTSVVKANRDLLRRVVVSMEAGREVDFDQLLEHELCDIPLSLANMDGSMISANKSQLNTILESVEGVSCPTYSIDKPTGAATFGDLADVFVQNVKANFSHVCTRVDVIFDRYIEQSTKHGAREQRARGQRDIKKQITGRNIRLP